MAARVAITLPPALPPKRPREFGAWPRRAGLDCLVTASTLLCAQSRGPWAPCAIDCGQLNDRDRANNLAAAIRRRHFSDRARDDISGALAQLVSARMLQRSRLLSGAVR